MNKTYFSVNNWLLDIPSGSILHLTTGERKRLGEYQLKLLEVFIRNAGVILTREELTNLVWERRVIGNNSLPNAIHALRSALEDDGKQQKIIKTIPKKGYLLEALYCQSVEKDETEVSENDDTIQPESIPAGVAGTPEQHEAPAVSDGSSSPHLLAGQETPENPTLSMETRHISFIQHRRLRYALVATILLALASCGSLWYYLEAKQNHPIVAEQDNNIYSNIRLYEIMPAGSPDKGKDNIYGRLKDTLYQLNQQFRAQSITMDVYYQAIDQTLNYTFSLKSRCDNKQLAMAIYHWRIDPMQLNNLILRETRRKLNEMANCTGV